jgi:hypothetical protein
MSRSTSLEAAFPSQIRHQSTTVAEMVGRAAQGLLKSACHLTVPAGAAPLLLAQVLAQVLCHFRQILPATITTNAANADAKQVPRKKLARIEEVSVQEMEMRHRILRMPLILRVPTLPSHTMRNE